MITYIFLALVAIGSVTLLYRAGRNLSLMIDKVEELSIQLIDSRREVADRNAFAAKLQEEKRLLANVESAIVDATVEWRRTQIEITELSNKLASNPDDRVTFEACRAKGQLRTKMFEDLVAMAELVRANRVGS